MKKSDKFKDSTRDRAAAAVLTIIMFLTFAVCLGMALIGVGWSMWVLAFTSLLIGMSALGMIRTGKWAQLRKR